MAGKKGYVMTPPRGSILLEVGERGVPSLILFTFSLDFARYPNVTWVSMVVQPYAHLQELQERRLLELCEAEHLWRQRPQLDYLGRPIRR
jgi:hypothetical protein